MKGIAHISFLGGGVVMPSQSPYERETLFQHLEAASRRHGNVRLRIDQQDWLISHSDPVRAVCLRCQRSAGTLTYRLAGSALCTPCARRSLQ